MGADARGAILTWELGKEYWTFAELDIHRDYGFFGRVANIRGDAMKDEWPKGPPENWWSKNYCGVIEHGYTVNLTWLTVNEFSEVVDDMERELGMRECHWQWYTIEAMLIDLDARGKKPIFVIGFDQG